MRLEIERKYLVKDDFRALCERSYRIIQGYLYASPDKTIRVRITDDKGYLTIKGKTDASGIKRMEWESEIPLSDARNLLELCEAGIIDKTRNIIRTSSHIFEVDVFHGENDGLILAEVELRSEDDTFEIPDWLGKEVTGDPRYYNALLSKNPYKNWKR